MMGSLKLSSAGSPFRLATWNAHSICNKRPEIESLIYTHDLDILGVTESWLRPGDVSELPGFMSYRADRTEGQGGGMLVLVRREYRVSRVVAMPDRPEGMDSVGVVLSTSRGPVAILCVYAPPPPAPVWKGRCGPPCWSGCGHTSRFFSAASLMRIMLAGVVLVLLREGSHYLGPMW